MVVETDKMIRFWAPPFYMSNFTPCKFPFTIRGESFLNSEAAYMYLKAVEFGDRDRANKILKDKWSAAACKKHGRLVSGYDDSVWEKVREDRMMLVLYKKYQANPDLRAKILSTKDKLLVEASPYDKVWGIGLSPEDLRGNDVNQWQGLNLLGECLMNLRNILKWEYPDEVPK